MNKEKSIELSNNLYTWYRMDLLITETDLLVAEIKNNVLLNINNTSVAGLKSLDNPAIRWDGTNLNMYVIRMNYWKTFDLMNNNINDENPNIRKLSIENMLSNIDDKHKEAIVSEILSKIEYYKDYKPSEVATDKFLIRLKEIDSFLGKTLSQLSEVKK